MGRLRDVLVLAGALCVLSSAAAAASGPAGSPLPGYPRFRGVMLVHDGSSATATREHAITSALKSASSSTNPNCTLAGVNPGPDLCWWGGPIVGAHKVHLIFWEEVAHPIGSAYKEAIERYFEHVATASGVNSNVYAVQAQYAGSNGGGEYKVSFGGKTIDVYIDKNVLPAEGTALHQCKDKATPNGICITDKDLQTQITFARGVENGIGHHWESSLHDLYFVFTPHEIGGCFYGEGEAKGRANACAFESGGYCAYHTSFENPSEEPEAPLYADLPDNGNVRGCDSFEHPNEAEGVDATLDVTSHEHDETITDPLGNSWLDVIGQEIADKCLPPETFDTYGGKLGGSLGGGTLAEPGNAFNQLINGHEYWLQREWSNTAFNGEGGCVQRMLPTSFAPPAEARATVPATFDGSSSGEPGDAAVYWVWSFGDGMQTGTPEATTTHTYAQPGSYRVTLTAFDEYGNSNTRTMTVTVGAAPPSVGPSPSPPAPAPVVNTVTVTTPPPPVLAYTAAQMAAKLGLPGNGTKFSGNGSFSLGHAACPPACGTTVRLYAKETRVSHKRRTSRWVLVGSVHLTLSAKGAGSLTVSLNAKGRALLHKIHRAAGRLVVTVEGQEGGIWTITRSLTLRR